MRSNAHHRYAKDVLLLRSETENPRDVVFPRRHRPRILEMAVHWVHRGDIRVLKLIWVRGEPVGSAVSTHRGTRYVATSSR